MQAARDSSPQLAVPKKDTYHRVLLNKNRSNVIATYFYLRIISIQAFIRQRYKDTYLRIAIHHHQS